MSFDGLIFTSRPQLFLLFLLPLLTKPFRPVNKMCIRDRCLCLRHALYAVLAAFKFKAAVRPLSLDGEAHFLHTAQLCLVGVQHLIFPASRFGIHRIHAEQTVRKQGGFFAARAASDLHNDAPVIIFILGQQQDLKPFLQKMCIRDRSRLNLVLD